jgi:hypothetical protein
MRGSGQAFRAGQGEGTERGFQPVNGGAMAQSTCGDGPLAHARRVDLSARRPERDHKIEADISAHRPRPRGEELVPRAPTKRTGTADVLDDMALVPVSQVSACVELRGIEPLTYSMRTSRATNCATAPCPRPAGR